MTKKISVEQEAKLARLRSGFTVQVFESIDGKEPKWAFVGSAKNLKSLGDLIAAIPSTHRCLSRELERAVDQRRVRACDA